MSATAFLAKNYQELTDPRTLPNLGVWLDARYPNGFGSASPFDQDLVATWTDLSGNGYHATQANSSLRPQWRNAQVNIVESGRANGVSGWQVDSGTGYGVGTLAYETAAPISGLASPKATYTDTVSGNEFRVSTSANSGNVNTCNVLPNTQYYGYLKIKNLAAATKSFVAYVEFFTSAGTYIVSRALAPSTAVATNATVAITGSAGISPSNAAHARVLVVVPTSVGLTNGDSFLVDDAMISTSTISSWVAPVHLPNALPAISFNANGSKLVTGSIPFSSPITLYAVATTGYVRPSGDPGALSFSGSVLNCGNSNVPYIYSGSGPADPWLDASPAITNRPTVISAIVNPGNTGSIWNNGVAGQSGPLGPNALAAGALSVTTGNWPGELHAVVFYIGVSHDARTRQNIERWLGKTWGISVA